MANRCQPDGTVVVVVGGVVVVVGVVGTDGAVVVEVAAVDPSPQAVATTRANAREVRFIGATVGEMG